MLDENLPTFFFRQSSSNPLLSVLYFTQNGTEPIPEYSLKKADPTLPQSKNKYAVALADPANQDVIYGEVVVAPEWTQPSLSASEIRAQGGVPPPLQPVTPDTFTIQLYNPDQQIRVKSEKSTWTSKESWEFEVPQQSFRLPSTSLIDQEQDGPGPDTIAPKILLKWARNSKFSKDITCYMTGRSVKGKKSKDPDITIAMVKQGREQTLTIYEPNLQRVDVEDRKGLELTLLLGAEVIREIFLFPNKESFNLTGSPTANHRNGRPQQAPSSSPTSNKYTMSSAMGAAPPSGGKATSPVTSQPTHAGPSQQYNAPARTKTGGVDTETQRLQAVVEQEKGRERKEREKRDRDEQKRIKKMLEDEEKERKRREAAAVEEETQRLVREYGTEGQNFGPSPSLPPRPSGQSPNLQPSSTWATPQPPQRPVSAGPSSGGAPAGTGSGLGGLLGKVVGGIPHNPGPPPRPQVHFQQPSIPQQPAKPSGGRRRGRSADGGKIQKKKSGFFS